MDENTLSNVVRIASGKAVDEKFHYVGEKLRRLGYLVDVDGRTSIFSRSFADFVLEQAGATSPTKSLSVCDVDHPRWGAAVPGGI